MKQINALGIGIQSGTPNVTAQTRINMFLEFEPMGDKTQVTAYGTPGLKYAGVVGEASMGNPRGGLAKNDRLYVVIGDSFGYVSTGFVYTEISSLGTPTGRVDMADNGVQLLIVDGTYGYIYTYSTGVLELITDPGFPANPETCCFLDGFYLVNRGGTGEYYKSAAYNGLSFDALDFATAESNPDYLKRIFSDHGELILFSELSTEFRINNGGSAFPFTQVSGATIEWGIAAVWSVAKFDNSVAWLAKNRQGELQVMKINGYSPQRISTFDIERIINSYTNTSNATAYSYTYNGHPFYQLNFDQGSWLYDGASQVWSQVKSYGIERHRGNIATLFNGEVLVADYETNTIYTLDGETYTDNGDYIISELTFRHIFKGLDKQQINVVQVDAETGVGNSDDENPQIMLQTSKDGGHTWGNERWAGMGAIGEYKTRARWTRLGSSRDFVIRLRISAPVKRAPIGRMDAIMLKWYCFYEVIFLLVYLKGEVPSNDHQ